MNSRRKLIVVLILALVMVISVGGIAQAGHPNAFTSG